MTEETLKQIYKIGANLEGLELANCGLKQLPENLFLFLPRIKYVDLRQNQLASLPDSLAYHQGCGHLQSPVFFTQEIGFDLFDIFTIVLVNTPSFLHRLLK